MNKKEPSDKPRLVVLSGAGISAESGVKTFRGNGGLWEQYDVMEVASIEGWHRNPGLVQQFYNERRRQLATVEPNGAHKGLAGLEKDFDVHIVTQNIDNLHERAGSNRVLHLHGELTKACSSRDKSCVETIGYREIASGEKAADGSPLRPFIVWFGEAVPALDEAVELVSQADILVVIGTSLNVYPAASLIDFAPLGCRFFLIDPSDVDRSLPEGCIHIRQNAVEGIRQLTRILRTL